VKQPIGTIYVAKISPELLLQMSVVDRRRIVEDEEILGIQRELKPEKVVQIKNYLSTIDATFPNSIIVNTTSDFISSESDTSLKLKVSDSTFTIIDGQHRVEVLEKT
jgi:DGQHR domain-containing protein